MKATTETKRKIFTALATITRLSWALSKDVYYTYGVFNIASLEDSKLWHYWIKYEQLSRMTDDVYRATAFQSGRKYLWYIYGLKTANVLIVRYRTTQIFNYTRTV